MKPPFGWIGQRDESGLQRIALLPLVPLSWLYGVGARLHRAWYRRATRRVTLPIPVISVGNLVVGGSGKTPTAAWLARSLRDRGYRVAVASRGYAGRRGRGEGVVVVSDGRHVRSRAEIAGDEPMLLAGLLPGVPVLVGADRVAVGRRACSAFGAEILVLDDGFHHHPLARDIDVVTIDAQFGFGNAKVLPRGPLREPLCALRHADALVVIDGPLRPADLETIRALHPHVRRFSASKRPRSLRPLRGGPGDRPDVLDGRDVGMIAALAQPDSLRRTLERLGARVVAARTFRDHHRYRERDFRGLAADAPIWVTTEKDAVKMPPEWAAGVDVRVLSIDLEMSASESPIDEWIEALRERLEANASGPVPRAVERAV